MRLARTLSALLIAAFGTAFAAEEAAPADSTAQPAQSRAFRDPVTGELRAPTPAEAAELAAQAASRAVKAAPAAPTVTQRADGAQVMRMNGAKRHYSRATVAVDGSVRVDCVEHPGEQHEPGSH